MPSLMSVWQKFSPLESLIKLSVGIEVWTKLRLITLVTKAIIRISAQNLKFTVNFFILVADAQCDRVLKTLRRKYNEELV